MAEKVTKNQNNIQKWHSFLLSCSSIQDVANLYPDRVITIKGAIDNMSQAEAKISEKLRMCYENDCNSMVSFSPFYI